VTTAVAANQESTALRRALIPLALAQFICSFAGTNMNVMLTDISKSLGTTVHGVQWAITLFLLVMAALMIPCGKLTDRYGRKPLFRLGLVVYGIGALLSAFAQGLPLLIVGYSIFEGVGTALLIPPVYILTTLLFTDTVSRAKAFGMIMAMAGLGAAAGPLIGGFIATVIGWRAAFGFQVLIVATIVLLSARVHDPLPPDPTSHLDVRGAVLSSVGLVLIVIGVTAAATNLWLTLGGVILGVVVLWLFVLSVKAKERAGQEPLLRMSLFRNKTSNLGLVTQNIQWLLLMGTSFTVSAYLQVVRHYSPIFTGGIFTAATVGMLLASFGQPRFARRREQRSLIVAGFGLAVVGALVLLAMASAYPSAWAFAPGLFLFGLGVGLMLTPSVNVVQSSFPERLQGEISGLSRSVSNLGSSLGAAIAGTILIAGLSRGGYAASQISLCVVAIGGLVVALRLPGRRTRPADAPAADAVTA
jgi:MFS family permease